MKHKPFRVLNGWRFRRIAKQVERKKEREIDAAYKERARQRRREAQAIA